MPELITPPTQQLRRISNSEVGNWLSCRRRYYYRFDLNVQPRRFTDSLSRGILFHLAMEAFNLTYAELHGDWDKAVSAGNSVLQRELMKDDEYSAEIALDTRRIYMMYLGWLKPRINEWEILEVEKNYEIGINDKFSMPLKIDLLVRVRTTGEVALVDYKTCYDFWSDDAIALSPQAAKYIAALRIYGHRVDTLLLEQVRYRTVKTPGIELIRRTPIKPNDAKIRRVLQEHIAASHEITAHRAVPTPLREVDSLRVLNPMVCKGCEVRDLCRSELTGGNIDYELKVNYKQNTYDYNQTQADMMELM